MNSGRKPACDIRICEPIIPSEAHALTEQDTKLKFSKVQQKFGNRCNHDPKMQRYYKRPSHYKRRFHVIERSISIIPQALENPFDYPLINGLMFHKDKNGRQKRSERVEAELRLLLPAIFDSVNLVNMQVGFYSNKEFVNFDYSYLVNVTHMNYSRVERNMRNLQDYGLVEVKKIIKTLDDGAKRTDRVIITVNTKLFDILNLTKYLLEDRKKALKNRKKMENKIDHHDKYLELFKPRSTGQTNETNKNINKISTLTANLKNLSRNRAKQPYNPLQDKRVLSAISDILKTDPSIPISLASKIVIDRINNPPDD